MECQRVSALRPAHYAVRRVCAAASARERTSNDGPPRRSLAVRVWHRSSAALPLPRRCQRELTTHCPGASSTVQQRLLATTLDKGRGTHLRFSHDRGACPPRVQDESGHA